MTDHFAALNQPRRPWLEPAALKDQFHRLTASFHPDIPTTGDAVRFAELNAAYQVLRDPAARLRHLRELEAPEATDTDVPPGIASRFMAIATIRRAGEVFAAEQRHASHALQQALLAPRRMQLEQQVVTALNDLDSLHAQTLDQLRAIDSDWPANRESARLPMAGLQAQFAYLFKWIAQLQELHFQLTNAG